MIRDSFSYYLHKFEIESRTKFRVWLRVHFNNHVVQKDCARECGWLRLNKTLLFQGSTRNRDKNWKLDLIAVGAHSLVVGAERGQQIHEPWKLFWRGSKLNRLSPPNSSLCTISYIMSSSPYRVDIWENQRPKIACYTVLLDRKVVFRRFMLLKSILIEYSNSVYCTEKRLLM